MNSAPRPRYIAFPTRRYERDVRKLAKSGADFTKLNNVIDMLVRDEPLPPKYRDHELKGKLAGIRECHVAPDWLLLYQRDRGKLLLWLMRTGSHRDVLGIE